MNHASLIAALCLTLSMALPTFAAGESRISEFYVAPTFNYFTWKETGFLGEQLVKETGPLFGVGSGIRTVLVRGNSGQSLTLSGKLDIYGGVVNYDGRTQSPSNLPVSTDVNYFGTRAGCNVGWGLPVGSSTVGPFAGFQYRFWMRDLNVSTTVDGKGNPVPVGGTTEYWDDLTTRLGIGWYDIRIATDWSLFAEGGAQYPFYTSNSVDTGYGTVTSEPQGQWSAFAEAGVRYKRLRLAVTFEEQRYSRSPSVLAWPYYFYQPASTAEYLGFSVGYCFW